MHNSSSLQLLHHNIVTVKSLLTEWRDVAWLITKTFVIVGKVSRTEYHQENLQNVIIITRNTNKCVWASFIQTLTCIVIPTLTLLALNPALVTVYYRHSKQQHTGCDRLLPLTVWLQAFCSSFSWKYWLYCVFLFLLTFYFLEIPAASGLICLMNAHQLQCDFDVLSWDLTCL